MLPHRIKLTEAQPNSLSFSHQPSVNQYCQSKHKKKSSVYHKNQPSQQYVRLKTDEKEPLSILRHQNFTQSINLVKEAHSASKLSKGKMKNSGKPQRKKKNKSIKHTISVINLTKNADQSKMKGSSTMTKRIKSPVDINQKIKQKLQDFRIVSNCLEEHIKEQKRINNEVNLLQILKIVAAFNRSQIAPVSKPLEKLIDQMIGLIRLNISQPKPKSILKKSISFESPTKKNSEEDGVQNTVKKWQIASQLTVNKEEQPEEASKLEQNLGKLKYESNRLKYFFQEISAKRQQKRTVEKNKVQQLTELRKTAKQQQKIIKQLSDSSSQGTYRSISPN